MDGSKVFVKERRSFEAKLIQSSSKVQEYYSILKNTLLSYIKVKSRISWKYDAYSIGKIKLAKMQIRDYSLEPRTPAPNFQVLANIVQTKVERIYEEKYLPYSIKLYFAHVGMWENAFECESELYGDFANLVKSTISFPYISNYLDHLFSAEDCTDSVSHLTREAAIMFIAIIL